MLPSTPPGHRGSPARPGRTGPAGAPRLARAAWATARPAANSARRPGLAVAIAAASPGSSFQPPGGPKDSAAATPAGRMSAIISTSPGYQAAQELAIRPRDPPDPLGGNPNYCGRN